MIVMTCRAHLPQLGIATTFHLALPDSATANGARLPYALCLHDYGANGQRFLTDACPAATVDARRVALLVPDGQNGCFLNMAHGPRWETYLLEGLIPFAERTFPLAGLPTLLGVGTGGWAAARLAAAYPQRFCASFAVNASHRIQQTYAAGELKTMPDLEAAFGDPSGMPAFPLAAGTAWLNGGNALSEALTLISNNDGSLDS
jgi:hypothetical protein